MIPPELRIALGRVLPGAELSVQSVLPGRDLFLALIRDMSPQRHLDASTARLVMNNPLYWILCWASGRVLAAYILEHPELVRDRRVLDFGSGSGVVAIAAAIAGATEAIACDIDPLALAATTHNAQMNKVSVTLSEDFESVDGNVDVILAADVLYDKDNLPWLQRFVDRAGSVLIADSRVRDFSVPPYEKICEEKSCTIPDMDESGEFNVVSVYSVMSKSDAARGTG